LRRNVDEWNPFAEPASPTKDLSTGVEKLVLVAGVLLI
jgi:hypothetical protein